MQKGSVVTFSYPRGYSGALQDVARRDSVHRQSASSLVLGDADLVALVLAHADLTHASFASVSRVCRVWRTVCRTDEGLLVKTALSKPILRKRDLMRLLALTSEEADSLPRGWQARIPHGFKYIYTHDAVLAALPLIGGMKEWQRRIEERGKGGGDYRTFSYWDTQNRFTGWSSLTARMVVGCA